MNPETLALFHDYEQQLAALVHPDQVHSQLADWLWINRDRVSAVISDLNEALELEGAHQFQAHIPTLAVGHIEGLVLVSANPGFNVDANALENAFRTSSVDNNREFCADFFNVFPQQVGANGWWSRALSFALRVQMGEVEMAPQPNPAQRWDWIRARPPLPSGGLAGVANFDLLPFHSTSDGFRLMTGPLAAQALLRRLAVATLRMVVNLNPAPRLIFIASASGKHLMDEHHEDFGLAPVARRDAAPYDAHFRQYVHLESGRNIVTFGRQLFAGNFAMNTPAGFSHADLAGLLRPLAGPPY